MRRCTLWLLLALVALGAQALAACAAPRAATDSRSPARHLVAASEGPLGGLAVFETPALLLDRVYPSMQGPEHVQQVRLQPSGPRQLLWVRGIRVEAASGDIRHLCHTNVDRVQMPAHSPANSTRLFTLSHGQTQISLPEGTAIPLWSDEPLRIASQALNPDPRHNGASVRFRTTVEFVPDESAATAPLPLYAAVATSLKPLRVADGATGHRHAHGSSEPLVSGEHGELSTWHWEIAPGEDVTTTRVSAQLRIAEDTTLHFAGVHVHPHARYLALWDRTSGTQLFRSDVRHDSAHQVDTVGTFSSSTGIAIRAMHDYELVSVYDNRSASSADAMATVFLYLRDPGYSGAGSRGHWRRMMPVD